MHINFSQSYPNLTEPNPTPLNMFWARARGRRTWSPPGHAELKEKVMTFRLVLYNTILYSIRRTVYINARYTIIITATNEYHWKNLIQCRPVIHHYGQCASIRGARMERGKDLVFRTADSHGLCSRARCTLYTSPPSGIHGCVQTEKKKHQRVFIIRIRVCISITTTSVFSACTRDEYIILPDLQ